ncbi:Bcr/CflA family multidrug efflux MFS transporter [Shewanella sp. Choline-02u-19]|uniref:purine nucleoside transporter PunC n=1 Tax=unclassified Shewanella TaxID=196818 RepID=UPI000C3459BF|nr:MULTISPECIES: purine nucleoside transporter PunC [unclassified Shewanella]PKG57383.1 Bcr/CflA family multidrug efflux MFS transporter [Shewanella sp. GutDb-MelDb]PKG73206.1 Bcr/CflA family multidrug efflux MFS transporter [Shewanella sp. GutCb]PKH57960.1 Bcr/CflA family multidrug efflux MFS transporter [Shewanella sp. Bg11-22]PKI27491.1 Bcr/CflA family multidrug efflux MFS transporter [Shewanella sp. Choline-02u-19]
MKSLMNAKYYIFLSYLALLSMLGFIATDMYLPAFKAIEDTMATSPSQVAMSLTFFLAGLALGQLIYGPIVERFGKRNALIFGLSLFTLASLSLATSESMLVFNLSRFAQAIGACSAGVIWQAIVIEKYDASKAQNVFSNIMPLVALSPALAPLLGAFILQYFGWESIFITLSCLAVAMIALTFFFVPSETKVTEKQTSQISYLSILKNTKYLGNVIIFGACSGAFFSYLTVWPMVMEQHGFDATAIGLSFIPQTLMFILGGYASKTLIRKSGSEAALKVLLSIFGLSVFAIVIVTILVKGLSIFPLLAAFSVLAACNGAIYPIVVNGALQEFSKNAAKAAGLQNFIQISLSFGASSLVAIWASKGETAIGWGIMLSSFIVFVGFKLRNYKSWEEANKNFVFPDPARVGVDRDEK